MTEEKTARHGDVVLVRVKKINTDYSLLETLNGEEKTLAGGELMIGVFGSRKALHGFSGDPPSVLKPGMELHLLNRGGVIGECSAFHRDLEWPTQLEYLGTVSWNGRQANLAGLRPPPGPGSGSGGSRGPDCGNLHELREDGRLQTTPEVILG